MNAREAIESLRDMLVLHERIETDPLVTVTRIRSWVAKRLRMLDAEEAEVGGLEPARERQDQHDDQDHAHDTGRSIAPMV